MSSGGSLSESQSQHHNSSEPHNSLNNAPQSQLLVNSSLEAKLYSDHKSPYHKAPQIVKDILNKYKDRNNCITTENFQLTDLILQPKVSENHYCMHIFAQENQQYYYCYECAGKDMQYQEYVLCGNCFDPNQHIGHHYFKKISNQDLGYCDCGSYIKLKSSASCSKHGQDKIININIPQEERTKFINIFKSLLEVALYLKENQDIFQKIIQKFIQISKNSLYYSKLILEILKMKTNYLKPKKSNYNSTYFLIPLINYTNISQLIIHLVANKDIKYQLCKFLIENYSDFKLDNNSYNPCISLDILPIILDCDSLEKLVDEGIFEQKMYAKYLNLLQNQDPPYKIKGMKIFSKYMKLFFENSKSITIDKLFQRGNKIIAQFSQQIAQIFLQNIIKIYKTIDPKSSTSSNKNKKRKINQARKRMLPSYKQCHKLLMRCIQIITQFNQEKVQNFRQYLKEKQISLEKFEAILKKISYFSYELIDATNCATQHETPISFLMLIHLLKKSPNCKELINQMWLSLLEHSRRSISLCSTKIYEAISHIIWEKQHFLIEGKGLQMKKCNEIRSNNIEKQAQMKSFFIKFLSLKQIILKNQLFNLRTNYLLEFEQVGKVMRTMCSYNENEQAFYFNGPNSPQQFSDKFALYMKEMEIQTIASMMYGNSNVYFGFEKMLNLSENVKQMLSLILSSQILYQIIENSIKQGDKKKQQTQIYEGYLYLFTLILIDGFTNGKNKEIHQKLTKLKNQKNSLKMYASKENEQEMILKLFHPEKISQKEKKSNKIQDTLSNQKLLKEEQQQKERKKRIFEEKRKKLHNKFKNKRQMALANIKKSQFPEGNILSDQDMCLMCHQKDKPNNQLVYLAKISPNNTLSKAVHGKNSKVNTMFSTCFHTLHIQCYLKSKFTTGRPLRNCLLCQKITNCFIPRRYLKTNQKLNLIFNNLIIAQMVKTYHNFSYSQNIFMMFFNNLVQSKGLNYLIDAEIWQKFKINDKSDSFIEKYMIKTYEEADEQTRKSYQESIEKFIAQINQCQSQACKLVQLILSLALQSKILSSSNTELIWENLQKLHQILVIDQYLLFQQQLQKILPDLTFPQLQSQMQQQNKQSLSFTLKQLPTDTKLLEQFIIFHPCSTPGHEHQKIQYYCLICGQCICQQCNSSQNPKLSHCGLQSYLSLQDYEINFINENKNIVQNIYFNDFKIPYCDRDEDYKKDIFYLNVIKLTGLINQFMEK